MPSLPIIIAVALLACGLSFIGGYGPACCMFVAGRADERAEYEAALREEYKL